MSENRWQIASQVTPKSLFTFTNPLFYFLHAILCPEHTILLKTIIDRSFRNCRQRRSILTYHCDVTIVDWWRHTNARYLQCDVIFVDCFRTHKLAQMWSSQVINSRFNIDFISSDIHGLARTKCTSVFCAVVCVVCINSGLFVCHIFAHIIQGCSTCIDGIILTDIGEIVQYWTTAWTNCNVNK